MAVFAVAARSEVVVADPPPPPSYEDAVQEAYDIVSAAQPGDLAPAEHAASILQAATGVTQPEIQDDLLQRPPDYTDAKARLQALLRQLEQPIDSADPAVAQKALHDVLAMHRYDALHQPPTFIDRVLQWLRDRLDQVLRLFSGRGGPGGGIPLWILYLIGVAGLLAAAAYIFLSTRGTIGPASRRPKAGRFRPPHDHFAAADRFAAKGDRVSAIRELCAAVAAVLAGDRTWEGSPLTVREIFHGAPDFDALRPLLLPFEAAVYGGREVDAASYELAAKAAEPFRVVVQAEEAA